MRKTVSDSRFKKCDLVPFLLRKPDSFLGINRDSAGPAIGRWNFVFRKRSTLRIEFSDRISVHLCEPNIVISVCGTLERRCKVGRKRVFDNLVSENLRQLVTNHL